MSFYPLQSVAKSDDIGNGRKWILISDLPLTVRKNILIKTANSVYKIKLKVSLLELQKWKQNLKWVKEIWSLNSICNEMSDVKRNT